MLDGLVDFITIIKDFVLSLVNGMVTLVESLGMVVTINGAAALWMPSFMVGIAGCTVTLLVILRILGR